MNKLPKTDTVELLKNSRDAENSIKAVLKGRMDLGDLTKKETEIFERIIHLRANIKSLSKKGRYKTHDLLEIHMRAHNISIATAKRDLAIVSDFERDLREACLELERAQLYEAAWEGIKIATAKKDAGGIASNSRVAKEILGLDLVGTGLISPEKIEQHINIIIADKRTNAILEAMLKNSMSVQKYNMSLEEILAEESAETPKDIDYEDVTETTGDSTPKESH